MTRYTTSMTQETVYIDLENDLKEDPSAVETTPSSRIVTLALPSLETKRRLVQFGPNHGRCLIENCFDARAVEYCHCVAKNFMLNTELNREDYQYTLIPLTSKMREIAIHRQDRTPLSGATPASTDFTTHVFPFANLPRFQSHLHPRFVILEAGRKMASSRAEHYSNVVARYPILAKALQLYSAWTRAPPPEAEDDESYDRPGGKDDNYNSNSNRGGSDDADTDAGRLQGGKKWERKGGSPTPGASGSRRLGKRIAYKESGSRQRKNYTCLSEQTLIEHERIFGSKKQLSSDAVQVWFKEVFQQASPQHSF